MQLLSCQSTKTITVVFLSSNFYLVHVTLPALPLMSCVNVFALVCYTKIKEQANNVEENKMRKVEKIKEEIDTANVNH